MSAAVAKFMRELSGALTRWAIIAALALLAVGVLIYSLVADPRGGRPLVMHSPLDYPAAVFAANNAGALLGAETAGMDPKTTSMAVPLSGHAVVLYRQWPFAALQPGMVIVFRNEDGLGVLHQIVEIGDRAVITAGSANRGSDGWVPQESILGVYIGHIVHQERK